MSSETLYRKYRSKDFGELIGQDHITRTLLNSIKKGTFAHAYLLTGPRGVGKTSVARLFAYKVNGIDYGTDRTYSDIIEIDAASNRRIDEIRELRDKVNIAPSALKYKVYIIDEVHMLTKEAFNALLKTLEEPPEHAIFVLATTDFHKVPDTITSRCIRFSFSSIPESSIKHHLAQIAKNESINIDEEALEIISKNSEGSFRDAISLLDQFRNSTEEITAEYVARILGMSPEEEIQKLLADVAGSTPKAVVEQLEKLRGLGSSDSQIIKQIIDDLRTMLINQDYSKLSVDAILALIENLLKVEGYSNKRIALEVALIEACQPRKADKTPVFSDKDKLKKQSVNEQLQKAPSKKPTAQTKVETGGKDLWPAVLGELKSNHSTLYAIARMGEPKLKDDQLDLYFKFPFHYKQMKLEKNHIQLEKTVKFVDGSIKKVNLVQDSDKDSQGGDNENNTGQSIKSISNIFGPSEVLES